MYHYYGSFLIQLNACSVSSTEVGKQVFFTCVYAFLLKLNPGQDTFIQIQTLVAHPYLEQAF